jgi:undecaprenyl-diphosphatase
MPSIAPAQPTPSGPSVWALTVLPLACVAAGCMAAFGSEAATAAYFAAWREEHREAVRWLTLFTNWGNPALYLVYAGILLRGLKGRRRGPVALALAYLAAQLIVSLAIERALKIGIGRPRPGVGGPFVPVSFDSAHNSMPSGHTVEMTLQTLPLAVLRRGLMPLMALVLALMGASRIVLGWHHPSDVLAGLALGLFGAALVQYLAPRLAARLPKHWSV